MSTTNLLAKCVYVVLNYIVHRYVIDGLVSLSGQIHSYFFKWFDIQDCTIHPSNFTAEGPKHFFTQSSFFLSCLVQSVSVPGVTVWVCIRFECVIRSGCLVQVTHFRSHFESSTVYKSTYFDYLRTSFKANVKLVIRKRNVWKGVLNKDD